MVRVPPKDPRASAPAPAAKANTKKPKKTDTKATASDAVDTHTRGARKRVLSGLISGLKKQNHGPQEATPVAPPVVPQEVLPPAAPFDRFRQMQVLLGNSTGTPEVMWVDPYRMSRSRLAQAHGPSDSAKLAGTTQLIKLDDTLPRAAWHAALGAFHETTQPPHEPTYHDAIGIYAAVVRLGIDVSPESSLGMLKGRCMLCFQRAPLQHAVSMLGDALKLSEAGAAELIAKRLIEAHPETLAELDLTDSLVKGVVRLLKDSPEAYVLAYGWALGQDVPRAERDGFLKRADVTQTLDWNRAPRELQQIVHQAGFTSFAPDSRWTDVELTAETYCVDRSRVIYASDASTLSYRLTRTHC